jgi:hypothetical protein
VTFVDHSGVERVEVRLRWWLPRGSGWRAAASVSDEARERLCDRTPVPDCERGIAISGAFPGGGLRSMTGYVLQSFGCRVFLKRYMLCPRIMNPDRYSGSPAAKGT